MGRCLIALFFVSGCDSVFDLEHVEPGAVIGGTCEADGDCVRASQQGRCECGYCSYVDAQCAGTSQRWNEGAGALAEACVPAVDDVDSSVYHTCAAMTDGTAWCWGANPEGQLSAAQPVGVSSNVPVHISTTSGDLLREVDEVAAGAAHSCALMRDRTVVCWGSNQYGMLGAGLPLGMGMRSLDPVPVMTATGTLTDVTQLAVGYFFTCALAEASGQPDAIYCWGSNGRDQLGDAVLPDSPIAVRVPLSGDVTWIDAGGEHACAIVDGGTYCWGRQANGRLGNGTLADGAIAAPQRVAWTTGLEPLPDARKLALGNRHSCAVKLPPGEFFCWGDNTDGLLGNGTTTARAIATRVDGAASTDNRWLNGGDHHTCGLVGSDTWCWGSDSDGQIGDGADSAPKLVPVRVIAADRQRDLTTGFTHTCALGADYKLRCWGANHDGQLGTGDTVATHAPTEIASAAFCPR